MYFKNYCLVVIGNVSKIEFEVERVSQTTPLYLRGGSGLVISTFSSAFTAKELNEIFKENNRSFFLIDLNSDDCGYNLAKKEIHDQMFGSFQETNLQNVINDIIKDLKRDNDVIFSTIGVNEGKTPIIKIKEEKPQITEDDIDKMSHSQRETLFNEIIDKNIELGIENISELDKKLLEKLAKNS